MKAVQPQEKTSLLLNRNHQAIALVTARAAIRHLMTDIVKGIDAMGNIVSWSGTDIQLGNTPSTLRWYNNEVSLFEDQPCLRSAPDPVTGTEKQWAVPTILLCNYHFGYRRKTGEYVSLKYLYSVYKGICQYCFEKVSMSEATKDHLYPRSLGGTNHDFNLVLACRSCNSAKDNKYPYFDVDGKEVKPKISSMYASIIPENFTIRDEWKPYLHID